MKASALFIFPHFSLPNPLEIITFASALKESGFYFFTNYV
jgi:hypothetical protein